MDSIDITYFGRTVSFPDLPRYRKFYARLKAGAWEPATFEVLKENIDSSTVYVDVGGWIGATPFWAAGIAKQVIVVEPDPVCLDILKTFRTALSESDTCSKALLPPTAKSSFTKSMGLAVPNSSVLVSGNGQATRVKGLDVSRNHEAGRGRAGLRQDRYRGL